MKCSKCGAELVDGAKFCGKCGTPTEAEPQINEEPEVTASEENATPENETPVNETPAEETPASETPVSEAPVEEEKAPKEETPLEPEEAKVSGEKIKGTFNSFVEYAKANVKKVSIIAVAALAVILLLTNFKAVTNGVMKLVLSPDKYFAHVVKDNTKDLITDFTKAYKDYILDAYSSEDIYSKIGIKFSVGDGMDSITRDYDDLEEYIDWFDSISLDYSVNSKKDVIEVAANGKLNGKDILSTSVITDYNNMYISIPELFKKTIMMEMEDYYSSEDVKALTDAFDDVWESCPNKADIEKLALKYSVAAIDAVKGVKVTNSKEIKAGDVRKKVTVLTLKLNDELSYSVEKALLEEFVNDKKAKAILEKMYNAVMESEVLADTYYLRYIDDFDDLYDHLIESAEDELEWVNDYLDDPDDDEYGKIKVYVDSKGKVVGFEVSDDDDEVFAYLHLVKGNKLGFEVSYDDGWDSFELKGKGKENNKSLSGSFDIKYEDEKILSFDVNKLDKSLLKTGRGSYDISFSFASGDELDEIAEDLEWETDIPENIWKKLLKSNIVVKGSVKPFDTSFTISLADKKSSYFTIEVTGSATSGKAISVPSSKNVICVNDYDDEDEFFKDIIDEIDTSTLINNLEKAKVPDDILDQIEDIMESIEDGDVNPYYFLY